eukprot:140468-Chlamydomonas_euryale.AAC.3
MHTPTAAPRRASMQHTCTHARMHTLCDAQTCPCVRHARTCVPTCAAAVAAACSWCRNQGPDHVGACVAKRRERDAAGVASVEGQLKPGPATKRFDGLCWDVHAFLRCTDELAVLQLRLGPASDDETAALVVWLGCPHHACFQGRQGRGLACWSDHSCSQGC